MDAGCLARALSLDRVYRGPAFRHNGICDGQSRWRSSMRRSGRGWDGGKGTCALFAAPAYGSGRGHGQRRDRRPRIRASAVHSDASGLITGTGVRAIDFVGPAEPPVQLLAKSGVVGFQCDGRPEGDLAFIAGSGSHQQIA